MSGFNNPVVGALNLIRKAIRSPNFVASSAGWTINQDGSAEFNNLTARGTVDVGTPTTPNVIIGTIPFPGGGTAQGMIEFTAPGDPHWSLPGYIAPTAGAGAGTTETGIMALYPPVYDGDPSHGVPNNQVSVNITQAADGPSQLQAGYLASNKLTTSSAGTRINGQIYATDPVNAGIAETWHAVAYAAGWSAGTAPIQGGFYRLTPSNNVEFRGGVANAAAAAAQTMFTLPVGYRPPFVRTLVSWCRTTSTTGGITVNTDGTVVLTAVPAGGHTMELDGLYFSLDS